MSDIVGERGSNAWTFDKARYRYLYYSKGREIVSM
jgi:hypothetical protein